MIQSRLLITAAVLLPSCIYAQKGGNLSNCKNGCNLGETCVGNSFSQPVNDDDCKTCAAGRYWWPCNFETLCFCHNIEEGALRVPPAPKSGLKVNEELDLCKDILTQDVFSLLVSPTTDEAKALYTYDGLCNAISQYNDNHKEKLGQMGTEEQMRAEIAAFLSHTAIDTKQYSTVREDMHCLNPMTGEDGKVYCQPCKEEHYDPDTKTCSQSYFATENSYKEYCDLTRQAPQGCSCNNEQVVETGNGYFPASEAYFARGALSTSWNYDYYGASQSLMGNPNMLCDNPDLVSTNSQLAWGVGIYKWMEKMQHGTTGSTAHKQALKGNFGGTVKVLNGPLECPANVWSSASHVDMVKDRVAKVCKTGNALGVYLEMDQCSTRSDCLECEGLKDIFESCQEDGSCPHCPTWTQFVRSSAPTVTPIRVESPQFDDWAKNYGSRNSACIGTSSLYRKLVLSLGSLLVLTGSQYKF